MNELMLKIKANSTVKLSDTLATTKVLETKTEIITPVPMVNVACSGDIHHGLKPGLLQIAGPSKHFKTLFGLLLIGSYMKAHPKSVLIFYDTEFGAAKKYFASYAIDTTRVLHVPVTNIEELKHDIINQLDGLDKKDEVIILIDSMGNLASKKEVDDAIDGKIVADMTRAKALKSLGRMMTPHLTLKDVVVIVINHTYKTLEMFSKNVVGGGTGLYYSANDIWIIGRQKERDGTVVSGYHFIINIEKSRTVKEGSKIPIEVTFKEGMKRWCGLFDLAVEGGQITKISPQKYAIANDVNVEKKEFKRKDVEHSGEFWAVVLKETDLAAFIKEKFTLADTSLIDEDAYEL